jgi:hypothetical protein
VQEMFARLSKAGRIVCGRPNEDGHFSCDQPLADVAEHQLLTGFTERRLVPLDGWVLDKKGVWHKTTRLEDKRRHGRATAHARGAMKVSYPDLPALARCPKCSAVQWLDPERLRVSPQPNR